MEIGLTDRSRNAALWRRQVAYWQDILAMCGDRPTFHTHWPPSEVTARVNYAIDRMREWLPEDERGL